MARAHGELMFASHDDVVAPIYVEKLSLEALPRTRRAVLAFSDMEV